LNRRGLFLGGAGRGVVVNPRLESLLSPGNYARRMFFLDAGCVEGATGGVDRGYRVDRGYLERADWHARLLNGSDYPLPGGMPLYSADYIVSLGLLEPGAALVLSEIRAHNPLLFDCVLKRSLRLRGRALAARVFETRRFFEGGV